MAAISPFSLCATMTQMTTERLLLRPLREADAKVVCALAGVPDVARMTVRIPYPYPREAALAWIRATWSAGASERVYGIEFGGSLAGCIGYMPRDRNPIGIEIGYWIGRDYRGRGLAPEAARAVMREIVDATDCETVVCGHFIDNAASRRVVGKLGFRHVGHELRSCVARGCRVETVVYALTAEEVRRAPWYRAQA